MPEQAALNLQQETSNQQGWTRVAFGDVVRKVNDKVDPWESGLERYVAGEHLNTDDLRIRRWGLIGDDYLGPAFHMRFKPGQVLYGSRRTYLRKVALADFEGITANTTYVLESKDPSVLMSELLPFVMQSEAFHAHSVAHSKGSVNPYVNFSDIASFEFLLPPIKEQERWVELLKSFEVAIDELRSLHDISSTLLRSGLDDLLSLSHVPNDVALRSEWESIPLSEVLSDERPLSYGILKPGPHDPGGVPMLRVVDFDDLGRRSSTEVVKVSRSVSDTSKTTCLKEGDVLLSIVATLGRTFVVPTEMGGWNVNRAIAVLPIGSKVSSEFLEAFFHSGQVRRALDLAKVGSTQPRINLDFLRTLSVPIPSPEVQEKVVEFRQSIASSIISSDHRAQQLSRVLQRQLAEFDV